MRKNEKFKSVRKKNRLTQKEMADILDVKQSFISDIENGKSHLPKEKADIIVKKYGVDIDWILEDDSDIEVNSAPNARPARFMGDGRPNMWIVPIKAQGGFLEGYGDNVLMAQNIEKVYFPFIGQDCFAFEIDGLSMLTEYVPGEYFVGTPIENFNHLVKGRVYVFQTIDGIILKEFVKIEGDYIYLRSQNEDFNPVKPIYLKDVKRVYQREMVIKN